MNSDSNAFKASLDFNSSKETTNTQGTGIQGTNIVTKKGDNNIDSSTHNTYNFDKNYMEMYYLEKEKYLETKEENINLKNEIQKMKNENEWHSILLSRNPKIFNKIMFLLNEESIVFSCELIDGNLFIKVKSEDFNTSMKIVTSNNFAG